MLGSQEQPISSLSFPGGSAGKESACNAGDLGLIAGLGRSPGEGDVYPLQYYGLENSMDRGNWWVTVHGGAKSQTQQSDCHFTVSLKNPSSYYDCLFFQEKAINNGRVCI